MKSTWQHDADLTPVPRDVEVMAGVLEGRHGVHAVEVAEFFAAVHNQAGDAGRSWAWMGVADAVREREIARLSMD